MEESPSTRVVRAVSGAAAQVRELTARIQNIAQYLDVHAAIVGAQILGETLEAALAAKMQPISSTLKARIFDGYGPLSSYAGKVDVAFGLKLISRQIYDDLMAVNKVRVRFAHSTEIISFQHAAVRPLVEKIGGLNDQIPELGNRYRHRLAEIDREIEAASSLQRIKKSALADWFYKFPEK